MKLLFTEIEKGKIPQFQVFFIGQFRSQTKPKFKLLSKLIRFVCANRVGRKVFSLSQLKSEAKGERSKRGLKISFLCRKKVRIRSRGLRRRKGSSLGTMKGLIGEERLAINASNQRRRKGVYFSQLTKKSYVEWSVKRGFRVQIMIKQRANEAMGCGRVSEVSFQGFPALQERGNWDKIGGEGRSDGLGGKLIGHGNRESEKWCGKVVARKMECNRRVYGALGSSASAREGAKIAQSSHFRLGQGEMVEAIQKLQNEEEFIAELERGLEGPSAAEIMMMLPPPFINEENNKSNSDSFKRKGEKGKNEDTASSSLKRKKTRGFE